jgi:uncharacterized protein
LEALYPHHFTYLSSIKTKFRRDVHDEIDWDDRLIGIKGPKGVGKTTLILQHIIEKFQKSTKALYVSMDSILVNNYSILQIAEGHINEGGTHLFIDEIHKYPEWSREIKTIYDLYPRLSVVFSGSSMLQIYTGAVDLSRRAVSYDIHGLSFREFIFLETGIELPILSLDDVLKNHIKYSTDINEKMTILPLFNSYLQYGYYPFYLESKKSFLFKLEKVIANTLEVDIPLLQGMNVVNIFKIKKLLLVLAQEVPFQPNIAKLSGSLELNKVTLNNYLLNLSESGLINLLLDAGKSYSTLSKPEKIYLNNPNLLYCLSPSVNKGTLREVFFYNQLQYKHKVNYTANGDFLIDEKYTIEVGGKNKTYKQIANLKNSFIASDELITGVKNKIPVWLFGLLY